ncbi:MAG: ABC transporter ATP-binding protein [Treponema sp.]|nr:ABC transporter ATP-binding protein [Treponema sp.]
MQIASQKTKQKTLLEVRNLSLGIKRKSGHLPIIDGTTFTIAAGEIVALVGESGCGKTLTSLSVSRLLPPVAKITGGEILLHRNEGEPVNLCSLGEKELCRIRGREIAMIFQEPRQSLNPLMRIGAQIAEAPRLHFGKPSGGPKAKAETELLQRLNFPDPARILAAYPHQLSGGMCQRVMIAIATICRPKLLIADEPTSSLDTENQDNIIELLGRINQEFGTAVLFVSHDLSLARRFCTRTLVMRHGKIIEEGPSETLFSAPTQPYTRELIGAIPRAENRPPRPGRIAKPFLATRGLSNTYVSRSFGLFGKRETKQVLKDVNLEIAAGEIFGLSGESGGGKSTLARCILGLIAYDGEILIEGQYRPRAAVQMVFQEPGASLNPTKRIGWLLEEPLVIHGIGTADERARMVDEMLALVGLEPFHKARRAHELSGGQKQRACIGRALMLRPKMLIADEAISSLDVFSGAQVLELFRDLRKKLGLTILFISHDRDATEYLCDRIAVMRDGVLRQGERF